MKHSILIVSILVFQSCANYGINNLPSSCLEEVKIGFNIPPSSPENSMLRIQDTIKPEITLMFESGFNDTLSIYVNDTILSSDYFSTNPSTSFTGKSVPFNYSKFGGNDLRLKIKEIHGKYCMETSLKRGYRILEISRWNSKWWANYSNYRTIYE